MKLEHIVNASVKGEYNLLCTRDAGLETERVEETGFFKNMVLDNFFTYIASQTAFSYFPNQQKTIRVGSGTTAPTAGQTTLVSLLASIGGGTAGSIQYAESADVIANDIWSKTITMTFQFGLGQFTGNVSEVGFALPNATAPTVHTRALVVDGNGNPTSITVTAQDQLTVIYKLTVSVPYTVQTGQVVISGVTYDYTAAKTAPTTMGAGSIIWPNGVITTQAHNGAFGAVGENPSGTSAALTVAFPASAGTRRNFTVTAATGDANLAGGITAINMNGGFKFGFTPAIPKTSTQTLSLTVGYNLGVSQ